MAGSGRGVELVGPQSSSWAEYREPERHLNTSGQRCDSSQGAGCWMLPGDRAA